MNTEIAIIGGGLAGLAAAWRLDQAGVDFVLLEARDRVGGRILSIDRGGAPGGLDLGPAWFWPQGQAELAKLVRELGLDVFAQHVDGDMLVERSHAVSPQRFPTLGQHPPSMRIVGGMGALASGLAGRLPRARLALGAPVAAIALHDHGVTLSAGGTEVRAQQLIVAMPPRLLADAVRFAPGLEAADLERWRRTATWMAPHAKFFALYDRPFWRAEGLSGDAQSTVGPLSEIHDATTADGDAALFGFLGIGAQRRRLVGETALAEASVAQLQRLFGPSAARPVATVFKDWSADSFTATAADVVATDHLAPGRSAWITGPWAQRLSLAGSETSDSEPGFLAGAVQAAERAVAERLAALRTGPAMPAARTGRPR